MLPIKKVHVTYALAHGIIKQNEMKVVFATLMRFRENLSDPKKRGRFVVCLCVCECVCEREIPSLPHAS